MRGQPEPFGFEIGYWTRVGDTRRGHARAAAALLTRVALEVAEADRVVIRCEVSNAPSRAIPERLGYQFEGIARAGLRTSDGPRDVAIYAQLPRPAQ